MKNLSFPLRSVSSKDSQCGLWTDPELNHSGPPLDYGAGVHLVVYKSLFVIVQGLEGPPRTHNAVTVSIKERPGRPTLTVPLRV